MAFENEHTARQTELVGRKAMLGLHGGGKAPTSSTLEVVPLPHISSAPKTARVIERGSFCVALADKGQYLGLFAV